MQTYRVTEWLKGSWQFLAWLANWINCELEPAPVQLKEKECMKLFRQCIMLVDNVNSRADNSWPTKQTAVWEKHFNIRRPTDTLLAQAEPALRFSTCSSLVAGPSLLREVRPSCSIYGGTHLASDRVFGWLTNMFPLGFKSHVEPNVTVDFFLFFSLQTHFRRNEKEMPGELEGDWLPNYTVNCCSFQQRITRLTNLGHLFCRSPW